MAGEEWTKTIKQWAEDKGYPVPSYDAAWTARCIENGRLNEGDAMPQVEIAPDGAILVHLPSQSFPLILRVDPHTAHITGRLLDYQGNPL